MFDKIEWVMTTVSWLMLAFPVLGAVCIFVGWFFGKMEGRAEMRRTIQGLELRDL